MDDHVLDVEEERLSPVIVIVTVGLILLFALGFLYQLVGLLL